MSLPTSLPSPTEPSPRGGASVLRSAWGTLRSSTARGPSRSAYAAAGDATTSSLVGGELRREKPPSLAPPGENGSSSTTYVTYVLYDASVTNVNGPWNGVGGRSTWTRLRPDALLPYGSPFDAHRQAGRRRPETERVPGRRDRLISPPRSLAQSLRPSREVRGRAVLCAS